MSSQGVQSSNPLFGNDKPDFTRLAGLGAGAIVGVFSKVGLSALQTNAINFIPPATAGLYRVFAFVNVRTSAAVNTNVTPGYTDGAGVARTDAMPLNQQSSATVVTNINNATGRFTGSYIFQIDNSATAITVSTTGTTQTLYDLGLMLERIL